jgi:hypothetical protein
MAAPDRWTALQSRPSRWSSLQAKSPLTTDPPNSSVSQLRRQAEDYNIATRLLRRRARRGDEQSALGLIKVREDAINQGIQTGGIRNKGEFDAGLLGRVRSMERGAADMERGAGLARRRMDMIEAGLDAETAGTEELVDPRKEFEQPLRVTPESRTTAALDIMEGDMAQDDALTQRGIDSAARQGVKDPTSILKGNNYRRTLDMALGSARTPAEVAALRERGQRFGVAPEAFDKRVNWWEARRNRRL